LVAIISNPDLDPAATLGEPVQPCHLSGIGWSVRGQNRLMPVNAKRFTVIAFQLLLVVQCQTVQCFPGLPLSVIEIGRKNLFYYKKAISTVI
jgi:hypothetical protein